MYILLLAFAMLLFLPHLKCRGKENWLKCKQEKQLHSRHFKEYFCSIRMSCRIVLERYIFIAYYERSFIHLAFLGKAYDRTHTRLYTLPELRGVLFFARLLYHLSVSLSKCKKLHKVTKLIDSLQLYWSSTMRSF